METETQTEPVRLREHNAMRGHFVLNGPRSHRPGYQRLTREDLQAIVQQAYDEHGIVAQLWTATPSANDAPQTSCTGTNHCAGTAHHFDCRTQA